MNAQVLAPPSASDLDAWGDLGNEGWSWKSAAHLGRIFSLQLPDDETNEQLNTSWAKAFADEGNGNIKASFTGVKENQINKIWVDTFKNLGCKSFLMYTRMYWSPEFSLLTLRSQRPLNRQPFLRTFDWSIQLCIYSGPSHQD